ncbi:MAG: lipopolysaccharide biosynthesis protein [Microcoleaceae cyanobacterium]
MSIKQKAIKGVFWSVVQNWGSQFGSLIVFLVLARLLTPEAFGLVALANVFLTFMQIFLEQGFTQALVQRQELEPEHLDTAFWTNVISGVILAGLSFLGAGLIANFFGQPKLTPILQCFSFLFIVNSFGQVHRAILSRELAFKVMAIRSVVGILIGGCVGVGMAVAGFGVWSLVSQQFVFETVVVIVMWQAVKWRPRFVFSPTHFHHLFAFGINVVGFKFLKFFNKRSDNLLIGYFLGEVALGYYAIAYRVLQVMTQLLIGTTNQLALPTLSKLQDQPEKFRQVFYRATQFTSLVAFPTFAGMAALTPELVITLFGEQWQPSIPIMRVLAFAGILHTLSFFNASVLMAMGKPNWRFWISCLEAVVSFAACLLVIKWGIVAVAAAYVVSLYLTFPVGQKFVNQLIGVSPLVYCQQFITPIVSSLIMVAGILAFKFFLQDVIGGRVLLVTGTALGMLIYGLAIWILNPNLFGHLLNTVKLARSKESV